MWMWKLQYVGYGITHMNDFIEKCLLDLKTELLSWATGVQ